MDFFETVSKRRSIRKFHATKVPEEVINKALDAALLAPNSSNMQPWEFYWVRSKDKKQQLVEACFKQPAASTAQEIIVAVARKDTWKRNQGLMLQYLEKIKAPKGAFDYYTKLVPLAYSQGPLGLFGLLKQIPVFFIGMFRPIPRGPFSNSELFQVLVKTTALACENFMLAITAQGFGCCPMEGYDESRVKKILGLDGNCRIVMAISVGETDPSGIYGPQFRHARELFIFEV